MTLGAMQHDVPTNVVAKHIASMLLSNPARHGCYNPTARLNPNSSSSSSSRVGLLHDLRRHPAGRAHKRGARHRLIAPGALALQRGRHTKVANAHAAVAINQNIAGLFKRNSSSRVARWLSCWWLRTLQNAAALC